jgi:hypothetical protein
MVRVLVTVSPLMYREAIALAVHLGRPGHEVRMASPEAAEGELAGFRPHLLVHNESAPIPAEALFLVPCRVEVLYSDGLDARVHGADGGVAEVRDMSTEGLLRAVDEAMALAGEEPV